MKVTVVMPQALTPEQLRLWRQYQLDDCALASPFLCPEYIHAVAAVRNDIRIGVMESEGRVIGFFPFQRGRWNVAQPVGGSICDLCGVISSREVEWDARSLVQQCGLAGWNFKSVPGSVQPLVAYHRVFRSSAFLDLRNGFESYLQERRLARSALTQDIARKRRRFEREAGPLSLVLQTRKQTILETLRDWKSAQRQRTNTIDVLRWNWVVELFDRLQTIETDGFAGVLSVLYAGEQPAAIHFGMRFRNVLHYWFPTYNRAFQKYSPGAIFLLDMAKACAADGIERIDLGPGDEPYKDRFQSGALEVVSGSVNCTLARRLVTPLWFSMRACLKNSPIRPILRSVQRLAVRA